MNAGIQGLAKKLIPIHAVEVRVCKYAATFSIGKSRSILNSQLLASGTLEPPTAQRFENETDRLIEYQGEGGPATPHRFTSFLLTFASASRQVNLEYAPVATPGPTNDFLIMIATPQWNNEVIRSTTRHAKSP